MSTANRQPSLSGPAAGGERRPGFRAVGIAVSKLARPVVGRRGGGILVRLKADWPSIIGADWAAQAWPAALGRDGALKLRTAPAAALELQHRAPLLIERINLYFGRSAVSRLVLVQGSPPYSAPPSVSPLCPLAAGDAEALDRRLADVADPELRAALGRLGRAVIAARG
ncbi:MAG: DUF721 domain-containing protein [Stellaceae bacterium]